MSFLKRYCCFLRKEREGIQRHPALLWIALGMEQEPLCRIVSSGTIPLVAGPEGSMGEAWGLTFNRLRRMERKGKSGGLLEPKRSHDDQEVSLLFHPPHRSRDRREGWREYGDLTFNRLWRMERKLSSLRCPGTPSAPSLSFHPPRRGG